MPSKIPDRPKNRRTPRSIDDDAIFLSIQCTADSHNARPWLVASFYLDAEAPHDARWGSSKDYVRAGEAIALLPQQVRVSLVDDKVISASDYKSDPFVFDEGSRSRFSFKCGICGLSVARRSEIVFDRFDKLAAAGVSEISLTSLAAILK